MNSADPHAFVHDPPDPAAIRAYLKLKNPGEIARLAASMAPRPESFNADSLIDSAIALRMAADAGLIRQREALVARMNLNTLLALRAQLGCRDFLFADADFFDPVKAPVLRPIQDFIAREEIAKQESDKEAIRQALAAADARTAIPRPDLPCVVEAAVRYATNEPECRWTTLERALIDFLGIYQTPHEAEVEQRGGALIKEELDREEMILASLKQKPKADPGVRPSKHKQAAKIRELAGRQKEWKSLQFYRDYFTPGMVPPPSIAERSKGGYEKYFGNDVKDEFVLALFATNFHAFWQKHRVAYLRWQETSEKTSEIAAKANRETAAKGPKTRDHNRWIGHTSDFISFLNEDANRKSAAVIQTSVKDFALERSGFKDKNAKTKVETFLGTLCNSAVSNIKAPDVCGLLERHGIKSCGEVTIGECLNGLKEALGRGRKKK